MIALPDDPRGRELVLMVERAKFERWLQAEVDRLLAEHYGELTRIILSPEYRDLSPREQARLAALHREIAAQLERGYGEAGQAALRSLTDYAELESRIATAILDGQIERARLTGAFNIPVRLDVFLTRQFVLSVAELPIDGLRFGEWWERQTRNLTLETRRQIQQGVMAGEGPMKLIHRILPARDQTDPAVYTRARREALIITRTAVNAVQNHAAFETYRAADDSLTAEYQYVAIRDSRTSAICRALDGNRYRYSDATAPRPPQHPNCRSGIVPVLARALAQALGHDGVPPMGGWTSYEEWLRPQSKEAQKSILGPTRAEWWRAGNLTLADAIDGDRRVLTLEQLRARMATLTGARLN